MPSPLHATAATPPAILQTISPCPPKDRDALAKRLTRLERKIFPSSLIFDYNLELAKRKISVILATPSVDTSDLLGYLVYQRQKGITWLHKLAVIESERGKGIGKLLVEKLCEQMETAGCRCVVLWVDEGNGRARRLYGRCGFKEEERLADYYGPGKTAVKMEMKMD